MKKLVAAISLALMLILPAAVYAAAPSPETIKEFAAGVDSYKKGEYEKALGAFMNAKAGLPNDADLCYYIGMCYMHMSEQERAAEFFQMAIDRRPDYADARFQLGTAHVLLKEYADAVAPLEAVYAVQPQRENVGYLLGLSYYQTGQFEKSIAPLTANVSRDKTIKSLSLYYIGLANVKLGRATAANDTYQELLQFDPTSPLVPSSQRMVDVIGSIGKERKKLRLNLIGKLQYDTNTALVPTTEILGIRGTRHKSMVEFMYLNAEYSLYKTRLADIRASYSLLQTLNNATPKLNFEDHILSLSGTYKTAFHGIPMFMMGTCSYDFALLDTTSYLQRGTIRPSTTIAWNKNNMTLVQYTFQLKEFKKGPGFRLSKENRDAKNHDFGFVHYLMASAGKDYIYAGYFHDTEVAQGSDWDYNGDRGITGLQYTFPLAIKLNIDYTYKYMRYGDNSLVRAINIANGTKINPFRKDENHVLSATLSKEVMKNLTLSLEYLYSRNDSSASIFDYEKNVISVGLNWKY